MGLGNLYLTLGKFDEAVRELEVAAQSPYATGAVVAEWVHAKIARLTFPLWLYVSVTGVIIYWMLYHLYA